MKMPQTGVMVKVFACNCKSHTEWLHQCGRWRWGERGGFKWTDLFRYFQKALTHRQKRSSINYYFTPVCSNLERTKRWETEAEHCLPHCSPLFCCCCCFLLKCERKKKHLSFFFCCDAETERHASEHHITHLNDMYDADNADGWCLLDATCKRKSVYLHPEPSNQSLSVSQWMFTALSGAAVLLEKTITS